MRAYYPAKNPSLTLSIYKVRLSIYVLKVKRVPTIIKFYILLYKILHSTMYRYYIVGYISTDSTM